MMPSIRELREGFEKWAKEENLSLKKGRLDYANDRTYTAWCAWRAALATVPSENNTAALDKAAAPTPPEVEPIGFVTSQAIQQLRAGNPGAQEISPQKWKPHSEPIYTTPPSPKASWDADGNPTNLEAAAMDLEKLLSRAVTVKMPGHESADKYRETMAALRKFLPEGK